MNPRATAIPTKPYDMVAVMKGCPNSVPIPISCPFSPCTAKIDVRKTTNSGKDVNKGATIDPTNDRPRLVLL